jgi:signal transduction histidine kinase
MGGRRHAVAAVGAGLLVSLPALVLQRLRLRRAAAEREAERARLSAQAVSAEQDERRRLSVALHDGPLQTLAGVVLMHDAALAALREGKAHEAAGLLEAALPKERATIQALRDLSFAMEPVVLRDRGFAAATRELAGLLTKGRGAEISVDVAAGDRLGENAQAALYQTLREALAQAERRRPRTIAVSLAEAPSGDFEAVVEDDGRRERRRGGIAELEERARLLGGSVSVETGPAGTRVVITVPVHAAHR